VSEFVDFYYDNGDLKKADLLVSVARNIYYYGAAQLYLTSLYKKMVEFDQLRTHECFAIFTAVKFLMSQDNFSTQDYSSVRSPLEKLKAKTPRCLRLLLWPEPAGANFIVINK